MNDALSELRRDLNIAFEKMQAMSGQLELLQQAHMADATKADDGPSRNTFDFIAWHRDTSKKDDPFKLRIRAGNKHLAYLGTPSQADFFGETIDAVLNAISQCDDEEEALRLSGLIANAAGYHISQIW